MKYWWMLAVTVGLTALFLPQHLSYVGRSIPKDVALVSQPENEFSQAPLQHIVFLGDVMLGRYVEVLMHKYGAEYPFIHFPAILGNNADYTFVNFESAMAVPHVPTPSGGMVFSVDDALLGGMTTAGVTHASLANNHSLNYGVTGYHHAQNELIKHNIRTFGHPSEISTSSVVSVMVDGRIVSIVAVHTLFGEPDRQSLATLLETLNQQSDIQIVYIHWGEEYQPIHSKVQEDLATWLSTQGVDMVVGHHPHVVQDIGMIDGMPVFYSLGNTIFDQYFSREVQEGLALLVTPTSQNELEITIRPIDSLTVRSQPQPMVATSSAQFLATLADRSEVSLGSGIKQGKLTFPLRP